MRPKLRFVFPIKIIIFIAKNGENNQRDNIA